MGLKGGLQGGLKRGLKGGLGGGFRVLALGVKVSGLVALLRLGRSGFGYPLLSVTYTRMYRINPRA